MKENKTVEDAAKQLPPDVQETFLELWKKLGTKEDTYNGDLSKYFLVMLKTLNQSMDRMDKLDRKLADLNQRMEFLGIQTEFVLEVKKGSDIVST